MIPGKRFPFASTLSAKTLITSLVVVLIFASAMIIAEVALTSVKSGLRNTLGEQQYALLSRTANAIDRQIGARQKVLKALAADIPLEESGEVIQDFLLQRTSLKQHFDNFYIFNMQSELIANFNQPVNTAKRQVFKHPFLQETISTGKEMLIISPVEENNAQPFILFTFPVKAQSGQIALIAVASIDLSQINLMHQLYQLKTGNTGYAYMSMEDGTLLAHSDPDRAFRTVAQSPLQKPAMPRSSISREGQFVAHDPFSTTYLVTSKKLQSGNWMLTAVISEAEMFSSIAQVEAIFPVAAILMAGLGGIGVWWVMHVRIAPLQEAHRPSQSYPVSLRPPQTSPAVAVTQAAGSFNEVVKVFLQNMLVQRWDDFPGNQEAFAGLLIDYLPVMVCVKSLRPDSYGQLVVWNQAAEQMTGYRSGQVIGKSQREIFPSEILIKLEDLDRLMQADQKEVSFPEIAYLHPDGEQRYLRAIFVPLIGQDERTEYILGIAEDITASRQRECELRTRQAELVAVNDASPLGLFRCSLDGYCTYINRTMESMSAMPLARMLGKGWRRCIHPEERFRIMLELASWYREPLHPFTGACRLRHQGGSQLWVSLKVVAVVVDGKINGYVGSVEDITARRLAEIALLRSEQRLRLIADNIPALVAYVTPQQRIAFANRQYEEAYGVLHEEMFGMHVCEVLGPQVYAQSQQYIQQTLAGNISHFEREVKQDHAVRYERVSYIPDVDAQDEVSGYYCFVENITQHKLVEAQLRKLVHVDGLTGIANRVQFEEKLEAAMRNSRHYHSLMALMFLDIDHFKAINDSLGHQGGDEVLREFAQRLLKCVRDTDTVARLAGDEFVIILEGLPGIATALAIAREIIACMEREFNVVGSSYKVTTSIGVAIRRNEDHDPKALLRRADEALYRAKSAGRNTFESLI